MNQAGAFNAQFFRPSLEGAPAFAASCRLFTRPAGNATGLEATQRADGSANANPIVLDAYGRCQLRLDPTKVYLFELRTPAAEADALVWQEDNIHPAAEAGAVVASVNGLSGVVTLDASLVPYVESSAAPWLTATDVEAALDQIADRANAPPASSVTVADLGGLLTATNVEDALAELATSSLLPGRTGFDGFVLGLAAGALAWQRRETSYMLAIEDGAAGTRDVVLQAGTWRIVLQAHAFFDTPTTVVNATQQATVQRTAGGTPQTVTCTLNWSRTGSSGHGYLIHAADVAVGTIVVGATETYTMSIAAMTLNGSIAKGSILRLEKVA